MSAELNLGPGDSGRTIAAKVGDTVTLRLPENPTTGFRWQAADLPGSIELTDDGYGPVPEGGVGQQNMRILRFRLKSSGQYRLNLLRMRAWEGRESSEARYSLTIDASD